MRVSRTILVTVIVFAACYLSELAEAGYVPYQSKTRTTKQKKRTPSTRTRRRPLKDVEASPEGPVPSAPRIPIVISRAEDHFRRGKLLLEDNERAAAREEFDRAMDAILESGIDVRSSEQLKSFYENLIERIYREELSVTGQGFSSQEFTPSPLDELSKLVLTPAEKEVSNTDVLALEQAKQTINFPFNLNPAVQQYINYYQGRGRDALARSLKQSGRYMKTVRVIFTEEGVPLDVAWMAQVLSEWNPRAMSITGASGIWQLSEETGRQMALRRTEWIDERLDLEKSTRAVARLLKNLAARYHGNWELAMSAFQAGSSVIDSAIRRGGVMDFWAVYPHLPPESRSYLPSVLATMLIAKNPLKYGLGSIKPLLPTDVLSAPPATSLGLIAIASDSSIEELRSINPQLLRNITPNEVCNVHVPAGKAKQVVAFLKNTLTTRQTSSSAKTSSRSSAVKSRASKTDSAPGKKNLSSPPNAELARCNLTADNAPELRGFRVGMTVNDALKKVPGLVFIGARKELREGEFSISDIQDELGSVTIKIDVVEGRVPEIKNKTEKFSSEMSEGEFVAVADVLRFPHFAGVQSVTLWFLDNYLSSLIIDYDNDFKWKTVEEFSSKVAEKLQLSGHWTMDENDAASSTLSCDGLLITVATLHHFNLVPRETPTLRLMVPTKWNLLVKRRFETEKPAKQEKKDSFTP